MRREDNDSLSPLDRLMGGIQGHGGFYRRMRFLALLFVVVAIVSLLAKAF